jgi:hypothetical protein
MMAKTLYKSLMQRCGVGEPGRSCKQPSNNIKKCSISEADIPKLGIRDESKNDRRPMHCGSIKSIDQGYGHQRYNVDPYLHDMNCS